MIEMTAASTSEQIDIIDLMVPGPEGPRVLRTLFWYDGPRIFTLTHEGRLRFFTCTDEEEGLITYYGASPTVETIEKVCANQVPLIEAYRTGPFFKMTWASGEEAPCIEEVADFPEEFLPDPDVLLVYEPKSEVPNP